MCMCVRGGEAARTSAACLTGELFWWPRPESLCVDRDCQVDCLSTSRCVLHCVHLFKLAETDGAY